MRPLWLILGFVLVALGFIGVFVPLMPTEATVGLALSPRWAAELSYLHLSHGYLAGPNNPGLDDLGLRVV